jgi:hypothetical protein
LALPIETSEFQPVPEPVSDEAEDAAHERALATAALMIAQTLILALIEKGLLGPDDILEAVEAMVEAQRSTTGEVGPELQSAIQTLIRAAEEVALH